MQPSKLVICITGRHQLQGSLSDALLNNNSGDDQPGFRHPGSVAVTGRRTGNAALNCPGCLERPVRDVLNQDTVGSASSRGKTLIGHQGESVIQVRDLCIMVVIVRLGADGRGRSVPSSVSRKRAAVDSSHIRRLEGCFCLAASARVVASSRR